MTTKDWVAVGSMVAGLSGSSSLSALGENIDTLAPGWGKKVVAVVSIIAFAAGLLVHVKSRSSGEVSSNGK